MTESVRCTPLWLAAWWSAVDTDRNSKSVEVQMVWEIFVCPGCFAIGLVPGGGLVLGRGAAWFRVVRIGGREVRKVRGNAVTLLMGGMSICIVILLSPHS